MGYKQSGSRAVINWNKQAGAGQLSILVMSQRFPELCLQHLSEKWSVKKMATLSSHNRHTLVVTLEEIILSSSGPLM